MTNDNQELIAELRNWPRSDYGAEETLDMQRRAADALEASSGSPHIDAKHWGELGIARAKIASLEAELEALTPRVVSTVEELDALPRYSVLLDDIGDAFVKTSSQGWEQTGTDGIWTVAWVSLPATVIYTPTTEGPRPETTHSLDHIFGDVSAQLDALTIRKEA